MSKRHLLGQGLGCIPFGLSRALRMLQQGRYLTVLTYHRVMDRPDDFPFDDDLISASEAGFRRHLDFITRHFELINFRILRERMQGGERLPGKALIITFDDGYRDNYEIAWPILREYGATATMFVTAGFIGRRRMFWWDRIAFIVKSSPRRDVRVEIPDGPPVETGSFPDRQSAARHLIKTMKFHPEEVKESFIETLADIMEVRLVEEDHLLTMDWGQVRELSEGGIEIGAHSVNHPIFSNTSHERLTMEVSDAKKMIEERTGTEVLTFGSPGRGVLAPEKKLEFEHRLAGVIAECGYSYSTMYRWGLAYENSFRPYSVPRINIESHDSPRIFGAKLAFPEIITY